MKSRCQIVSGIMGGTAVFMLLFLGQAALQAGGLYSDSGQSLGGDTTYDVVLGDVDGDNDLDAFAANATNNHLWLNNGSGAFNQSGQAPGTQDSFGVALGDVDGDNDLDAYVANGGGGAQADELWLNNGGVFTASGQMLSISWNEGVALADLDGDNDLDVFLVAWSDTDSVWLNQGGRKVVWQVNSVTAVNLSAAMVVWTSPW